jgi:hypothetical protein
MFFEAHRKRTDSRGNQSYNTCSFAPHCSGPPPISRYQLRDVRCRRMSPSSRGSFSACLTCLLQRGANIRGPLETVPARMSHKLQSSAIHEPVSKRRTIAVMNGYDAQMTTGFQERRACKFFIELQAAPEPRFKPGSALATNYTIVVPLRPHRHACLRYSATLTLHYLLDPARPRRNQEIPHTQEEEPLISTTRNARTALSDAYKRGTTFCCVTGF